MHRVGASCMYDADVCILVQVPGHTDSSSVHDGGVYHDDGSEDRGARRDKPYTPAEEVSEASPTTLLAF